MSTEQIAVLVMMLVLVIVTPIIATTFSMGEPESSKGIYNDEFYDGDYDHGYVEVREGAFMFWWLYYAEGNKNTSYEHPLVIWLQGGPGAGGSGFGNFLEIGPQDLELRERNSSWEIQAGTMTMNFKTIGLGSAFVDPKPYLRVYPRYIYYMGFLDKAAYRSLRNQRRIISEALDKQQYLKAHELYLESIRSDAHPKLGTINIYNVVQDALNLYSTTQKLEHFMNTKVKKALHEVLPNYNWTVFSNEVNHEMRRDILRPSTFFVEKLLNTTKFNIVVYNGQLDAITSIAGAVEWVHRLKWRGAEKFQNALRQNITASGDGYYKMHEELSFWWVYKSGHSVPADNPEAMEVILNRMVDSKV